ncbi:hypothetical protein [Rhodopseudomonas sp. BR0M22]|uniref:hypothetical protein n=1 Tax=Rhodopseudomonas sp. BR0M22 TaxID=2269369 RepID=UPI0013DE91BC|nr:hypothetical protein [Rhodopseudomonas sp. BR0M22]MCD0419678.1 hypothetical protein [Rubrivivax sp. JA1024]NEW91335.1 hypothetical protein [Rhodopseudomonas sp. BR0M22]
MTDQAQSMDRLHRVMASIRRETKSAKDPSKVFREFLSHLDQAHSAVPRRARAKPMPRRPAKKRAK